MKPSILITIARSCGLLVSHNSTPDEPTVCIELHMRIRTGSKDMLRYSHNHNKLLFAIKSNNRFFCFLFLLVTRLSLKQENNTNINALSLPWTLPDPKKTEGSVAVCSSSCSFYDRGDFHGFANLSSAL